MSAVINDEKEKGYILALDAGGTMTDTILVMEDGSFTVGKSLTNRADEPASYLESIHDAALSIGKTSAEVHSKADVAIYAGTGMLNTVLTGTGQKVGLLVTRGFEDITVMEGGLTYLGQTQAEILHCQLHEHTRPMVDPMDVLGVGERTCGGSYFMEKHLPPGQILIPLNERHVRENTNILLDRGVEVIGILFTNSFINDTNEQGAKKIAEEIIAERGLDIPVVCSAEIAPVLKENNRMKSLLLQCTAAENTRATLLDVEKAANEDGYDGQLLTLLSYGGAVNVSYPRLYETVISGPIGGLMGAQVLSKKLGIDKLLCADMGGTSFDVGLVINHQLAIRKDPDFAGHRLALPMVSLDSVGSGAGSDVYLDEYKRLHVGPGSAGADIGICFKHPNLTVTDVNVAMGYVDPNYFLGGKVTLDQELALETLRKTIAEPLGLDVYEAGKGILEVVNTQMREAAMTMLLSKGYNPREFTMMCYGGAGPVHMWGYTEGMPLADIITLPYAAAFSAFGAACAEYMHRYHKGLILTVPNGMSDQDKLQVGSKIDETFRLLEDSAKKEMEAEGADISKIEFQYGVYMRYMGQLESFETVLDFGTFNGAADVDLMVAAYEEMYTSIYPVGARFPEAGYALSEVYIKATVPKAMPEVVKYPMAGKTPKDSAYVSTRQVSHKGEFFDFKVWQMGELEAGNIIEGPSIIRDPMTTVIIPPGKRVELDEYRMLHYR